MLPDTPPPPPGGLHPRCPCDLSVVKKITRVCSNGCTVWNPPLAQFPNFFLCTYLDLSLLQYCVIQFWATQTRKQWKTMVNNEIPLFKRMNQERPYKQLLHYCNSFKLHLYILFSFQTMGCCGQQGWAHKMLLASSDISSDSTFWRWSTLSWRSWHGNTESEQKVEY